jgi:hypothetical protein
VGLRQGERLAADADDEEELWMKLFFFALALMFVTAIPAQKGSFA